jgi:hypothetical protein
LLGTILKLKSVEDTMAEIEGREPVPLPTLPE